LNPISRNGCPDALQTARLTSSFACADGWGEREERFRNSHQPAIVISIMARRPMKSYARSLLTRSRGNKKKGVKRRRRNDDEQQQLRQRKKKEKDLSHPRGLSILTHPVDRHPYNCICIYTLYSIKIFRDVFFFFLRSSLSLLFRTIIFRPTLLKL
jgi:hypothetical protein